MNKIKTFSYVRMKLVERMVKLYGEENILVMQFIDMCQSFPNDPYNHYWNKCLTAFVEAHENDPQEVK